MTKLQTFKHNCLPIFQHSKMFRLQHQFSDIVETTQLNDDQMPEFHCHCECSKCPPLAPSYNTSLQSSYLRNLSRLCWSVQLPQIILSAFLSLALVFGFVLSLR